MKPLSLFKYPGGKSRLVPQLRKYIDVIIEKTGSYSEVFIGGGPVLLDIASDKKFKNITLLANDLDEEVYSFWEILSNGTLEQFNSLLTLINKRPTVDMFWEERKTKQNKDREIIEKAYHCVFFHKTTFNGMSHASPIGGKDQNGKWKIDCHYNEKNLVKKILEARERVKNRLIISNVNALDFIETHSGAMYLDPPYYTMGHKLYSVSMSEEEHKEMAAILRDRQNWVLSYDDCPTIRSLYSWANIIDLDVCYRSSGHNKSGKCARKSELVIIPR